jgi:hypothetical protein
MTLPPFVTPEDFAEHFGASARTVRETARRIGACAVIGQRMILLTDHVTRILAEMTPCPSNSPVAPASGTLSELSPDDAFARLLARQTAKPPKGSGRKRKPAPGNVISMGRART